MCADEPKSGICFLEEAMDKDLGLRFTVFTKVGLAYGLADGLNKFGVPQDCTAHHAIWLHVATTLIVLWHSFHDLLIFVYFL